MVLPQKENRMFPKVGQPMKIESKDSKSEGKAWKKMKRKAKKKQKG